MSNTKNLPGAVLFRAHARSFFRAHTHRPTSYTPFYLGARLFQPRRIFSIFILVGQPDKNE